LPFRSIKSISCDGTATVVTAVPTLFGATCQEMYMAFAPLQSLIAGFTPRDVFITSGPLIYRFTPPNPPNPLTAADVFAVIPDGGCEPDHTGITFDHTGNFGYNMIVTCKTGGVWKVTGNGTSTFIANVGTEIEGPGVAPSTFGPYHDQILVADEADGQVHAISNTN